MPRLVFPFRCAGRLAWLVLLVLGGPLAAAQAEPFTVQLRTLDDRKAVFATVESVDVLAARARLGGTVRHLVVDEGDAVTAGARLALVVDDKLAPRIQALESQLDGQQATVDQARTDLRRAEQLRAQGAAPQSRLDAARTALEVAERQRDSLRSDLDVLRQQVTEGEVLAPVSGRVLEVTVSEGSVVLPGEAIARVATEHYVLRLRLPERHARFIQTGDTVRVGPRGLDPESGDTGARWRDGTIVKVYPELEAGRVLADVAVEGLGGYFVGERALVDIVTGHRSAFVVPPRYVRSHHGVTMARLDGGAWVVVQVGAPVPGGVEVLSGLRPGDTLVPPDDGPGKAEARP
ncbi:efflux RND transporter periplasmic adaptor subunit [Roseospira marina]|uniref:Efflux RND transporter periplasmic adaptor subunit n=1 Tax=Roseospira marina TaxID=140057 RepID=A0A5M6IBG1_9PROT|nr:efflux RND transporter periplasmic adaptor subunit [Roseospira marina]KAA5605581.1 efflux RND transporter periplasmic adaptor subunit [Roseospira marina]MBB4313355.1 RND family efflux transporter MFP subunit [Roseospira marina]MBB5085904.1 RND family efflux transporter MFP subunit [Roseospira marina]